MTASTYGLSTLLSWQSLVVLFSLPFMKQTGLMESKSFDSCGIIEGAVFQSAALQENSGSESLCSFLSRSTRGSFQNKMPNICLMLGYKAPSIHVMRNSWRYYCCYFALLGTRIDPTQTRLWRSDGVGVGLDACAHASSQFYADTSCCFYFLTHKI